jgi:hypothetical protein
MTMSKGEKRLLKHQKNILSLIDKIVWFTIGFFAAILLF